MQAPTAQYQRVQREIPFRLAGTSQEIRYLQRGSVREKYAIDVSVLYLQGYFWFVESPKAPKIQSVKQ
jgi:hypothetical protein